MIGHPAVSVLGGAMNGERIWGPSISLRIGELFGALESSKSQGNVFKVFVRWTLYQSAIGPETNGKGGTFLGCFLCPPDRDSIRGVDL